MNNMTTKHTGDIQHSNNKPYLIGFILSIILTIIPFAMVMNSIASKNILIAVMIICAVVQILIHLIYFLHLNTSSEQQWNLIAFLFVVLIIAIFVVGSLWIMWYLKYNLMTH